MYTYVSTYMYTFLFLSKQSHWTLNSSITKVIALAALALLAQVPGLNRV